MSVTWSMINKQLASRVSCYTITRKMKVNLICFLRAWKVGLAVIYVASILSHIRKLATSEEKYLISTITQQKTGAIAVFLLVRFYIEMWHFWLFSRTLRDEIRSKKYVLIASWFYVVKVPHPFNVGISDKNRRGWLL